MQSKPSTRFVRHKRDDEDFRDLAICYRNLSDLCELFDQGQRFIASLIAVEVAKLVATEGRDQSPVLLRVPQARGFLFSSTPAMFLLPPGCVFGGKFNLLVQETIRPVEAPYGINMVRSAVPRCWEYVRHDLWPSWDSVPFSQWWDSTVVMSESNTVMSNGSPKVPYSFTRRGLIKAVRDAQGAHSRGTLREDELPLNEPNAFTFAVGYSGQLQPGQEVRHLVEVLASQAAVRQIGEEILHTINTNNRAGLLE